MSKIEFLYECMSKRIVPVNHANDTSHLAITLTPPTKDTSHLAPRNHANDTSHLAPRTYSTRGTRDSPYTDNPRSPEITFHPRSTKI